MALSAGGKYYNAKDGGGLVRSVERAIRPTIGFRIVDQLGKEVDGGVFGEKVKLLEGKYTLIYQFGGKEHRVPFRVRPGRETILPAPRK